MAIEFKLPDVGEGLHEAELLKWMVNEGDYVREDQPIMEVQTDKAAVEITSPVSAKIAKLNGKVGDILHVGSVVVVFDDGTGAAVPKEAECEAGVAAAATRRAPDADDDRADRTGRPRHVDRRADARGDGDRSSDHIGRGSGTDRGSGRPDGGSDRSARTGSGRGSRPGRGTGRGSSSRGPGAVDRRRLRRSARRHP
jgi:pyruvate dehydrogenase E2 component (dihydrolipoamide acetyltransferase)